LLYAFESYACPNRSKIGVDSAETAVSFGKKIPGRVPG